jgi:hypothetical protein
VSGAPPRPRLRSQDPTQATYFIPEGWGLPDALGRLPAAFAGARPVAARNLERIAQAKKDSGGKIGHYVGIRVGGYDLRVVGRSVVHVCEGLIAHAPLLAAHALAVAISASSCPATSGRSQAEPRVGSHARPSPFVQAAYLDVHFPWRVKGIFSGWGRSGQHRGDTP